MRLTCFWCMLIVVEAQNGNFYAPQTYRQSVGSPALFRPEHRPWETVNNRLDGYQKSLFAPAGRGISALSHSWTPGNANQGTWKEPDSVASPGATAVLPRPEHWKPLYSASKEHQAAIIHHKQALTAEGGFRFEYASDNGQAAGEVIEPDGTRLGGYQYTEPNGQIVTLKYRAGKDGFQILEGSHLPKSREPEQPRTSDNYYQQAYSQQRQQYQLQQQYNQQKPNPQYNWKNNQESGSDHSPAGGQYFVRNWSEQDLKDDDGQYRDNDVGDKKPHSFGGGYAFSFKG